MLTIDDNLFNLGLRIRIGEDDYVLKAIERSNISDNRKNYKLAFYKLVTIKCKNIECGYINKKTTEYSYCPKCYVSYLIDDLTNYGLDV